MTDDLYQEVILEEYRHPQNQGKLDDATLVLRGGNASCGDKITIYLKLADDQTIQDVKWKGEGCAISTASMSLLSQKIKRDKMKLSDLQKIDQKDLLEIVGLETIISGREKCLELGLSILKKDLTGLSSSDSV